MNIQELMLVVKNVLTPDECQSIINEFERKKIKAVKEANTPAFGEEIIPSNYRSVELDNRSSNYNLITSKMNFCLQTWVDYLREKNKFHIFGLKINLKFPHRVRILKYSKNEFINPHSDFSTGTFASVTLNLNDDYTGGKFVFMNGLFEAELGRGDAVIFPADYFWVHEITPVIEGNRYSVNSFILSHPLDFCDKIRTNMLEYNEPGIFDIK